MYFGALPPRHADVRQAAPPRASGRVDTGGPYSAKSAEAFKTGRAVYQGAQDFKNAPRYAGATSYAPQDVRQGAGLKESLAVQKAGYVESVKQYASLPPHYKQMMEFFTSQGV